MVAFFHDHGTDMTSVRHWKLAWAMTDEHLTVRSTEPWDRGHSRARRRTARTRRGRGPDRRRDAVVTRSEPVSPNRTAARSATVPSANVYRVSDGTTESESEPSCERLTAGQAPR
ncbi:hypothetical protein BRD06_09475 [Halobacteriales archaeon QS_9_67_15]|nr:MAG: hypothetical protein BRD06_09475 [Halobacteriales archaeon QS_9_67_15]